MRNMSSVFKSLKILTACFIFLFPDDDNLTFFWWLMFQFSLKFFKSTWSEFIPSSQQNSYQNLSKIINYLVGFDGQLFIGL